MLKDGDAEVLSKRGEAGTKGKAIDEPTFPSTKEGISGCIQTSLKEPGIKETLAVKTRRNDIMGKCMLAADLKQSKMM